MEELIRRYREETKKDPSCYDRYRFRQVDRWGVTEEPYGSIKHRFWWIVHNCVAHPLIGICPIKKLHDFHDWTSKKLNNK